MLDYKNLILLCTLLFFPKVCFSYGSNLDICQSPIEPVALSNPTIITEFTEAALQTALNTGGHITFDTSIPITIYVSSELVLSTANDTVIDGLGLVTLDGQNSSRILEKGWHDPSHDVSITLQNLRLVNGKAPTGGGTGDHSGGAVNVGHPGTSLYIIDSTFENNSTTDINTADNQGGAIFVSNSYETVISGAEFRGNFAGNGGAFGGIATGLFIYNSIFSNNSAVDDSTGGIVKGHGGAVHLDGVTNSYNPNSNKEFRVCGSRFENNSSVRGGGAFKVTVSDNKGIKATYEKSEFINNVSSGASETEGHGGAIYHIEDDHDGGSNEINVEISECTFNGNTGWRQGGGAWITALGEINITNSTFVNNQTSHGSLGMGGGLVLSRGESTVTNCTFSNNYAWFHGGGIQAGGSAVVTLRNILFYNNESEREWACYQMNRAADMDGGGNLQYPEDRFNQSNTPDDCTVTPTVIIENPLLKTVADNGGPTDTIALLPGSPAINGGTSSGAPATDQRQYSRDAQCDIGAYEFGAKESIQLTDIIIILQLSSGKTVDFSEFEYTDINNDNKIGLHEALYGLQVLAGVR